MAAGEPPLLEGKGKDGSSGAESGGGGADAEDGDSLEREGFLHADGIPWANPVLATLAQHLPYLLLDDDNKVVQSAGDMRHFTKNSSDTLRRAALVDDLLLPELVRALLPLVRAARETLAPSNRSRVVYKVQALSFSVVVVVCCNEHERCC